MVVWFCLFFYFGPFRISQLFIHISMLKIIVIIISLVYRSLFVFTKKKEEENLLWTAVRLTVPFRFVLNSVINWINWHGIHPLTDQWIFSGVTKVVFFFFSSWASTKKDHVTTEDAFLFSHHISDSRWRPKYSINAAQINKCVKFTNVSCSMCPIVIACVRAYV